MRREKIFTYSCITITCILILTLFPTHLIFNTGSLYGGDLEKHFVDIQTAKIETFHGHYTQQGVGGQILFLEQPTLFFFVIKLVSLLIPLAVTIKLIMISVLIIFAIGLFLIARSQKFTHTKSLILTISTLFIVLHNKHSEFGGNFASLAAGEIAYFTGILGILWYLTTIHKRQTNYQALIIAITFLIHPLPGTMLIFMHTLYTLTLNKGIKNKITQLSKQGILVFLLTIWWVYPFIKYTSWISVASKHITTQNKAWIEIIPFSEIMPPIILLFSIIATIGFIIQLTRKLKIAPLQKITIIGAAIASFFFVTSLLGWSPRFLPIAYLCITLFATSTTLNLIKETPESKKYFACAVIILLTLFTYTVLTSSEVTTAKRGFNAPFAGAENIPHHTYAQTLLAHIPNETETYVFLTTPSYLIDTQKTQLLNANNLYLKNNHSEEIFLLHLYLTKQGYAYMDLQEYAEYFNIEYFMIPESKVEKYPQHPMKKIANQSRYTLYQMTITKKVVIPLINKTRTTLNNGTNTVSENNLELKQSLDKTCKTTERYVSYGTYNITTTCPNSPHVIKRAYQEFWNYKDSQITTADKIQPYNPGYMYITPNENEFQLRYIIPLELTLLKLIAIITIVILILLRITPRKTKNTESIPKNEQKSDNKRKNDY